MFEVRRLQLDLDKNGPDSLRQVLANVNAGHLPALAKPAVSPATWSAPRATGWTR